MPETANSHETLANDAKAYKKAAVTYITLCVLLFFTCLGLGYFLYQLRQTHLTLTGQSAGQVSMINRLSQDAEVKDDALKESRQRASELESSLAKSRAEVQMLGEKLGALSEERAGIEEQLAEFKRITKQFKKMIDTGKLKVSYRNGRILLQLPAAVLFPLGSADLMDDGLQTVLQVAQVLKKVEKRRFIVGGHTDNTPITSDRWKSNWELSTSRAVTVTEALIESGMTPERLGAAGFAETDPIAVNDDEKGRRLNRRIEIIVEPLLPSLTTPGAK